MAINPTYAHDVVLSKVKLGNTVYYVKDADLRAIVNAFGDATAQNVAVSIAEEGTGLVTSAQVYDFVTDAVSDLTGATHFLGVSTTNPMVDLEDDDSGKVTIDGSIITPTVGDIILYGSKEFIYGGSPATWKEIGDEGLWVPNTRTIAGINLQDNITVTELKTALSLKALAYKDSATGTITGVGTSITGASYTPEGSVTVASEQVDTNATITASSYTPQGTVAITADTAAAVSYDKTTSVTIGTAAASGDGNYTPSGTVSVTNVTVTPANGTVATVTNAGTGYTITEGSVSQGADAKSAFATSGLVANMDTIDDEMLVFTAADTSNAVTASGAVSYTAPTLSGALPTFGTQSVVTGITSASATATFAGDKVDISATPTTTATAADVTQPTFSADFTGTAAADMKVTNVSYKKTNVTSAATFEGTAATITPTLNTSDKTVTVS